MRNCLDSLLATGDGTGGASEPVFEADPGPCKPGGDPAAGPWMDPVHARPAFKGRRDEADEARLSEQAQRNHPKRCKRRCSGARHDVALMPKRVVRYYVYRVGRTTPVARTSSTRIRISTTHGAYYFVRAVDAAGNRSYASGRVRGR